MPIEKREYHSYHRTSMRERVYDATVRIATHQFRFLRTMKVKKVKFFKVYTLAEYMMTYLRGGKK